MMKKIIKLYQKYAEIINYLIVGGLTTLVSLVSYYFLVATILNPENPLELQIANIASWIFAVIFAYITNRKYVFKSDNKEVKKEALKFLGARLVTLVIDMLFMFLSVTICHFNDKIMKIISNIIVIILNYVLSKLFVFIKGSQEKC